MHNKNTINFKKQRQSISAQKLNNDNELKWLQINDKKDQQINVETTVIEKMTKEMRIIESTMIDQKTTAKMKISYSYTCMEQ